MKNITSIISAALILILGAVTVANAQSCQPLPAGAVGWWPGNGNGLDIVKGNDGQLVNGVSYAPGKVEQAFSFNQNTQQYIDLAGGTPSQLLSNSAGSISAWVNQAPVAVEQFHIATAFGSGVDGQAVGFGIDNGNIRIYHHTASFDWQTAVPVSVSTWTMITYTWDASTERLYKNGDLAATRPRNFSYVPGFARVGFGFINDPSVFFSGQIDEVAIYARTLSASEVTAIFNADTAGMCPNCSPTQGGLVSWWPGESNGDDIVGGNNGTLMNGVSFANGKVGQAFNFDGINDVVRANNTTQLNGGSQATYDAWVYPTAVPEVGQYFGIIGVGDSTLPSWTPQQCRILYWRQPESPAGHARYYADCGLNNNESYIGRMSSRDYPINSWSYVTAVFNNGNLDLYVNGALDNGQMTGNGGTFINTNSEQYVWIGAHLRADGSLLTVPLQGMIDEPGISSQAMTPAEVRSVYNSGKSGKCNSCTPQASGLISWWRGEANSNDAVGSNYGFALGGTTFAPGKVGSSFSFNGSTAFVRIPDNATLDVTTEFTLAAWVKPASIPTYPNAALVISKIGPIGNLNGYQMAISNIGGSNKVWCGFNTGGNNWPQYSVSGGSVPVGEWTYISCTYDHSILAVQQNGEQVATASVGAVTVANTSSDVRIGSDDVAQQFYSGLIDEPMIFGRSLATNELLSLYRAGAFGTCITQNPIGQQCASIPAGLASWWRAQGNALDKRKANHMTPQNGVSYASGRPGSAFALDGIDDHVTGQPFNMGSDWSVEGWILPVECSDSRHCPLFVRSNGNLDGLIITYLGPDHAANGEFAFNIGTSGTWRVALHSYTTFSPGTWHHVAATKNGDTYTLYVDGTARDQVTIAGVVTDYQARDISLGRWNWGTVAYLKGKIDEVSVYKRPLSPMEVWTVFSAAKYNLGKCVGTQTMADLDGDMLSDLSMFRPTGSFGAEWWWLKSSGGNAAVQFGASTDIIVPGDYTGDGKADVAFWRPANGNWFILRSDDFSFYAFPFGSLSDIPVPADYDGDAMVDSAVFRPASATWYINQTTGGTRIAQFGAVGDSPISDDFDGDGKADIGVFRPNGTGGAEWWIAQSTGGVFATQFGQPTDKAVPADYTGDGKADIAFWNPSSGYWFVLRSDDLSYFAFPFGAPGDVPVPADYDGDARYDAGVFRPSTANWFVNRSTAGILIQQFGANGDLPLPNAYVR